MHNILFNIRRMRSVCLLGLLLMLAASGCGQKGPLYLPEQNATSPQQAGECPEKRCTAIPADNVSDTTP
jgi:predicted small lipoprotein YifL